MVDDRVADLLRLQSGVVARGQLVAAGLEPHDVRRLLRRRLLVPLHDGAAAAPTDHAALAVLADGVQSRRTTAVRLGAALGHRARIARRDFLAGVIEDLRLGTCSVLEHGYLHRVERAHGLPLASRQVRASARGPVYRDVDYAPYPLLVELDGRVFHDSAVAHGRDLQRDLVALVGGAATARIGWMLVFDQACWTAAQVGELLTQRGWTGKLRRCPTCP